MRKGAERTHKGPANAVIREATETEIARAFADDGGSVSHADRIAAGGAGKTGGKGSTTGIRLAPPDGNAETAPDARAAANIAARAARRTGGQQPQNRPNNRPAAILEDWEVEAGVSPPAAQDRPDYGTDLPFVESGPSLTYNREQPTGGDMLERAKSHALAVLNALPPGVELFVGTGLDQSGVEFVMGLGFLIGAGSAVYCGNGHYRITNAGRKAAKTIERGG